MKADRAATIVLVAVVIAVAGAVVWASTAEEQEEPTVVMGDLTVSGSLARGDVSISADDGNATFSYGSVGTTWYVQDLESPAYRLSISTGAYLDRAAYSELDPTEGGVLTIDQPGKYHVRMVSGNIVRTGTVVLDGDITKEFSWTQTIVSDLLSFDYKVSFTYRFSHVLAYQDDPDAVRHLSGSLDTGRFIVVDDDIVALESALRAEYREVRPLGSLGGQDYADYLLSFVQCCIAYPDMIAYQNGRYVKDAADGNPDLSLYGRSEYWAYPMETVQRESGDCEDTSFLSAALFAAAGYPAGVLALTDHMISVVGLDSFTSRGTSRTLTVGTLDYDGTTLYMCETTTERSLFAGYVSNEIYSEALGKGTLSMSGYVSTDPAEDDPVPPADTGDDRSPADLGYVLPDGFSMDYYALTLSYTEDTEWHVTDLLAPYYDGPSVYTGRYETGSSIALQPGLYRIEAAGSEFDIGIGGSMERTASWPYDLDGTVSTVSVSFSIDIGSLVSQRERAQAFNTDGHQRLFSELPGLVETDGTTASIASSLRSEFLRIGGDPSDRQAYADFISSFAGVAVEYPLRVSGEGEDFSIYGQDEYWAMPLQTLSLMQGDCEDKSVLLCALFAASGFDAAVGGRSGHVFAGVALDSFEDVPQERLKELDPYRTYLPASSVPVAGSCEGGVASIVFYAAETTHGQVPVGYLTSGDSRFGTATLWGTAGFYPYVGDRCRPWGRNRGSMARRRSSPCRGRSHRPCRGS